MAGDEIPETYETARQWFRRAAGDRCVAHPIAARGPAGEELTIDVAMVGEARPTTALVVLSGVHGVEGFVNSALQTRLLQRMDSQLPDGVGVVLVHAVNPWGMAHGRRQNESNVDLNRNWRRGDRDPDPHPAYDEVHALACPDTATLPDVDEMLATAAAVVAEHGADWLADAITRGQYRHPDGLHFGGDVTEESCQVLERVLSEVLVDATRVFVIDLHTGVGRYGELTLLSNQPADSAQDVFLRDAFAGVDATLQPTEDGRVKNGPIAAGIADLVPNAEFVCTTAEFGTADDLAQLAATYQEQWVHRRGSLDDPAHVAARERYRRCFTPDDPAWVSACLTSGDALLDAAFRAVQRWGTHG